MLMFAIFASSAQVYIFFPEPFWRKLQSTHNFSLQYFSIQILNHPELSNLNAGYGKLLHCAPRVSLQIVPVLERVFRSHRHDLLMCKRKENMHLLCIMPCAGSLPMVSYLNPFYNSTHIMGNWGSERLSNLPQLTQCHYSSSPFWHHQIIWYLPLPFIFSVHECMEVGQCGQTGSNLNVLQCKNWQADGDLCEWSMNMGDRLQTCKMENRLWHPGRGKQVGHQIVYTD